MVTGVETASFEENKSSAVASYSGDGPGAGHAHVVCDATAATTTTSGSRNGGSSTSARHRATRQRTSYTVTVRAADDGGLTGLAVRDRHGDGRGGRRGRDHHAAAGVGRNAVHAPHWKTTTAKRTALPGSGQRSTNRSSWNGHSLARRGVQLYGNGRGHRQLPAGQPPPTRTAITTAKTASAVLAGRIGDASPTQNTTPEFTETAPVTRSVGQGTAAGRSIGSPVRATDPDSGDILTYVLTGPDADTVRHRHGDGPASDEGSPRLRR